MNSGEESQRVLMREKYSGWIWWTQKLSGEIWTDLRTLWRRRKLSVMCRMLEKTPSGNTLCHSIQCFSEAELSNISILDHGVGRSILPGDAADWEGIFILMGLDDNPTLRRNRWRENRRRNITELDTVWAMNPLKVLPKSGSAARCFTARIQETNTGWKEKVALLRRLVNWGRRQTHVQKPLPPCKIRREEQALKGEFQECIGGKRKICAGKHSDLR